MTIQDNLIATIRSTQKEPDSYSRSCIDQGGWYDSPAVWELRSDRGRIYIAGSYCCPKELEDPSHQCPYDGRGTTQDVKRTLGLDDLLDTQLGFNSIS